MLCGGELWCSCRRRGELWHACRSGENYGAHVEGENYGTHTEERENYGAHVEDRGQFLQKPSPHMDPKDKGHIIKFGRKCLKSLSHFSSLILAFLKVIA